MSQKLFSNINGTLVPASETEINSSNEAVRSRYGLYETMLMRDGIIELADLHWERLWTGMAVLGFSLPELYTADFFEKQVQELAVLKGVHSLGRIRIQIYAESNEQPYQPFFYIEATAVELSMTQWNDKGLIVGILEGFRKPIHLASNSKISHSQHIPLARKVMAENSWDDALLLNAEGRIIESSMANLFWIKDGQFYTSPLSEGCLAGTMRAWIIEQLKKQQFSLTEKALSEEELLQADEVFLTNSIRFVRWIEQIGETHFTYQKTKAFYDQIVGL
ncbi:MAG: aminotransferase class IV [Bacteroidota bacterium]